MRYTRQPFFASFTGDEMPNVGENACEFYGALPEAAAAVNRSAIQTALDRGGFVTLTTPGIYFINDTLKIGSNTNLLLAPGVTIRQASGTNKCMLATTSLTNPVTATVTIAWTSGTLATVTWNNHGLTVSDYVTFQGANQGEYNNIFPVAAVLTANTFTIRLYRTPTTTATGTITGYKCNTNFTIEGGTWDYNYAENPSAAQGINRHAIVVAFAARFEVNRISTKNVYKYGLNTCAVADYQCFSTSGDNVSEIVKHYGPCANGHHYGIYGQSNDDATTIQAREPAAFIAYMPAYGDIFNLRIDDVNVKSIGGSGASGAVCVYASDVEVIEGIVLDGVIAHASAPSSSGIKIRYGQTDFSTGKIKDITIRRAQVDGLPSTQYAVNVSCDVDELRFEEFHPLNSDLSTQLFRQESTSQIRNLVLSGMNFTNTAWPSPSSAYTVNLSGDVDTAKFENCFFQPSSSQGRFITVGTGAVRNLVFENVVMDGASQFGILQAGASVTRNITMIGCRLNSVTTGWDVRSPGRFNLIGNEFTTITNGVVRPNTTTGLMATITGSGNVFSSATAIICANSATADVMSLDIPVDPAALGINPTAGNIARRAATGRIMRADGAAWADI